MGETGLKEKAEELWLPSEFKSIKDVTFELIAHYNVLFAADGTKGMEKAILDASDFHDISDEPDLERCLLGRGLSHDRTIGIHYNRIFFNNGAIYQNAEFYRHGKDNESIEAVNFLKVTGAKGVELSYITFSKESCLKKFAELPKQVSSECGNSYSFFLTEMKKYATQLKDKETNPDFSHHASVAMFKLPGIRKHEMRKIVKYVLG